VPLARMFLQITAGPALGDTAIAGLAQQYRTPGLFPIGATVGARWLKSDGWLDDNIRIGQPLMV
jgi:hypothetical protein